MHNTENQWRPYIERYAGGEWRAPVFHDMVLADVRKMEKSRNTGLTLLDIGCGGGFDNDPKLQRSLSQAAQAYVGVEPDPEIVLENIYTTTFRCTFEEATIPSGSIDIAFAVMVMEHFEKPQEFWDKVHAVLKPGGVFWGFTIDARHWFPVVSLLTEKLHLKEWYLDVLHGKRGEGRYENYGVFYRSNTPRQLDRLTHAFRSSIAINFARVGQLDYYFPQRFLWVGRAIDRGTIAIGFPGSLLAVRVEK